MFYNERNENYNNQNFTKGYCSVKLIQECWYPKVWRNEECNYKKDRCENSYYNKEDNCYEKQKSYCDKKDYNKIDDNRWGHNCEEDYEDQDKDYCKCKKHEKEYNCNRHQKECFFCRCFKSSRW